VADGGEESRRLDDTIAHAFRGDAKGIVVLLAAARRRLVAIAIDNDDAERPFVAGGDALLDAVAQAIVGGHADRPGAALALEINVGCAVEELAWLVRLRVNGEADAVEDVAHGKIKAELALLPEDATEAVEGAELVAGVVELGLRLARGL